MAGGLVLDTIECSAADFDDCIDDDVVVAQPEPLPVAGGQIAHLEQTGCVRRAPPAAATAPHGDIEPALKWRKYCEVGLCLSGGVCVCVFVIKKTAKERTKQSTLGQQYTHTHTLTHGHSPMHARFYRVV